VFIQFETAYGLDCHPECDLTKCRTPVNCKGGFVKDICNCCPACAKVEGNTCGGLWNMHGFCDKGLKCEYPNKEVNINMRKGKCVVASPEEDSKECKTIGACRIRCDFGFLPPKGGSCIACTCRKSPKLRGESCGGKYHMNGVCKKGLKCVENKCRKSKQDRTENCPPVCEIYCIHGNIEVNGCPTCKCKSKP